jgi:hypothetical protein
MPERLVDVEKEGAKVLDTFLYDQRPRCGRGGVQGEAIAGGGQREVGPERGTPESECQEHVSRGGQLTPYGDPHGMLADTKAGLDQVVRERAYLLWSRGVGRMDAHRLLASSAA